MTTTNENGRYEGWRNFETWNVVLWIDNEFAWYQARLAASPTTAAECRAFALEIFGSPITPDGAKFSRVDWSEVAEHWNAYC